MNLRTWLEEHHPIGHRRRLREAGFDDRAIRRQLVDGIDTIGRNWVALADVDPAFRAAAQVNGQVACVSAARLRGWWVPPSLSEIHVHVAPSSGNAADGLRIHRSRSLLPTRVGDVIESVEDTLQHVPRCLDEQAAYAVWESASRRENLSPDALRRIPWNWTVAHQLAATVTGLPDSGLESLLLHGLRPLGRELRPQAYVAGHRVDLLIDEWLIIQVDGYAFHSSSADRGRDVAHDAELLLRGYGVLRFTYAQVVHDWPNVQRTIRRALLTGPLRR
ncbi:endonuclease domain-containing protein [Microbacterium sp. ZW T5_56]|uniref:endonuclease domain-containing protein n=1 Tax=Microbacterium sp. ZW T5_56 TaxID=3378081 RepID=UPI003855003D